MNILPKKRWHVRTKENIARVRKDEAKAAEEEQIKVERAKLAEREARTELLRQKSRRRVNDIAPEEYIAVDSKDEPNEHINFFKDVEDGIDESKAANKEHEKEKKEEQEQYEKKIGYLTYLGQDTHEALGTQSWYNVKPERSSTLQQEVDLKGKSRIDPLNVIKKLLSDDKPKDEKPRLPDFKDTSKLKYTSLTLLQETDRKKHKKHKKKDRKRKRSSSSSEDEEGHFEKKRKLEIMRMERLKREREERQRAELLLSKNEKKAEDVPKETCIKRKYNSQFNPELARQNLL